VIGQRQDIFLATAQGRQVDLNHVEAVIEILAEAAFAELAFEIAVGGGDDAYVDAFGPIHAERSHFAILQNAQKLGLQGQGKLGDLVEKQGSTIGSTNNPWRSVRAVECAPRA